MLAILINEDGRKCRHQWSLNFPMKSCLKYIYLTAFLFITSCNLFNEDACYDRGHSWDLKNSICSDDCVREGGIFEVENKQCEWPSLSQKITDKSLSASVQTACLDIQKILEKEFKLSVSSSLNHADALQYDFPRAAQISYTQKYDFGQDGFCTFIQNNNEHIKVFIRKNANIESAYFAGEFSVLRIEKKLSNADKSTTIWERD